MVNLKKGRLPPMGDTLKKNEDVKTDETPSRFSDDFWKYGFLSNMVLNSTAPLNNSSPFNELQKKVHELEKEVAYLHGKIDTLEKLLLS